MTRSPRHRRRTRRASGALLAFSAIGVVVMSIMVFTQGFLRGAVRRTDAVMAGRTAEALASAAANEALLEVQRERNGAYQAYFFGGGGSFSVPVPETQGLAPDGVQVYEVDVEVSPPVAVQGLYGGQGSITIVASAAVPRRIARTLGTSSYRTVTSTYQYKTALVAAPDPYDQYTLYVQSLAQLGELRDWYQREIVDYWNLTVRDQVEQGLRDDAEAMVEMLTRFQGFVRDVRNVIDLFHQWPDRIPGPGIAGVQEWTVDPKIDVKVEAGGGGLAGLAGGLLGALGNLLFDIHITKVKLHLDPTPMGEAYVDISGFGSGAPGVPDDEYHARPEIPAIRPLVQEEVDQKIEEKILEYFGEAMTVQQALDHLAEILAVDLEQFHQVANTVPGFELAEVDFGDFREVDDSPLTLAVVSTKSPLTADDLQLEPPPGNLTPRLPDSPLQELRRQPRFSEFTPEVWRSEILGGMTGFAQPFVDFQTEWPEVFTDYLQAWSTLLSEYHEQFQLIDPPHLPPSGPLSYDWWAPIAAYQFPNQAAMQDWISAKGEIGAVYRMAPGQSMSVQFGALPPGDGVFLTDSTMTASGRSAGSKVVVSRGQMTVDGQVEAAVFAQERPVLTDGARIDGLLATSGLYNDTDTELMDFTITYQPPTPAERVVICEYPVASSLERGVSHE